MSEIFRPLFKSITEFLLSPVKRRVLWIAIICLFALVEFLYLGLARRTFVFYTINEGIIVVEDRMLKRAAVSFAANPMESFKLYFAANNESREGDIIRYTQEALLGPVSPDLLPLFPSETRLKSLLFRDGVVYADFSEAAALAPAEGGRTLDNFRTLYAGILRNFSYVRDVRFFIEGNAIYVDGQGYRGFEPL